jgi:hypothetical protein
MYYISYGCTFIAGPTSFRVAWALQMIPAIILFCLLLLLPESPRWLASKGRWEEAHSVVANVNAKGDLQNPLVLLELDEVKEAVRIADESSKLSFLSLFSPYMWKRTFIGCSAQMWQQLVSSSIEGALMSDWNERNDVLHFLRILDGWVDRQYQFGLFFVLAICR